MRKEEISHIGIVKTAGEDETVVEIISQSACGSCHASGFCSASEAIKKEIIVPFDSSGGLYKVGDKVDVILGRSKGMTAVFLAYVLPLVLMMTSVLALSYAGINELLAGVSGLGLIAFYYFLLYLFRDKIAGKYVFYIRKKY